jgi:hypothetical protein
MRVNSCIFEMSLFTLSLAKYFTKSSYGKCMEEKKMLAYCENLVNYILLRP